MKKIELLPEVISDYENGNYKVTLWEDGTKVIIVKDNDLKLRADFPDSIDLKITNNCSFPLCPYCYEQSNPNGKHGNLNHFILDTLHKGTELAIGGGNVLVHPNIDEFLIKMKDKGIICNMTVNAKHLNKESYTRINDWMSKRLIWGLGISLTKVSKDFIESIYNNIVNPDNVVLHTIYGLTNYNKLFFELGELSKKLKVLVLGYKFWGNGQDYFNNSTKDFFRWSDSNAIIKVIQNAFNDNSDVKVLIFDNLAVNQLELKDWFKKNDKGEFFNKHFSGDDGTNTMYIDLVTEQFSINSTNCKRYDLNKVKNIEETFNKIKVC